MDRTAGRIENENRDCVLGKMLKIKAVLDEMLKVKAVLDEMFKIKGVF